MNPEVRYYCDQLVFNLSFLTITIQNWGVYHKKLISLVCKGRSLASFFFKAHFFVQADRDELKNFLENKDLEMKLSENNLNLGRKVEKALKELQDIEDRFNMTCNDL